MLPLKRSVAAAGFGLAFLVVSAGAGHAVVAAPASHSAPVTQCNADPGFDSSRDPVHCHYTHPLPNDPNAPDTHWWKHPHY